MNKSKQRGKYYHKGNRMVPRLKRGWLAHSTIIAVLWTSLNAFAYEQTTHAAMTREAIMQSQLNPATPDLLQRLGVSDRQVSLGNAYLDLSDEGVVVSRSNAPAGPQYPPDF